MEGGLLLGQSTMYQRAQLGLGWVITGQTVCGWPVYFTDSRGNDVGRAEYHGPSSASSKAACHPPFWHNLDVRLYEPQASTSSATFCWLGLSDDWALPGPHSIRNRHARCTSRFLATRAYLGRRLWPSQRSLINCGWRQTMMNPVPLAAAPFCSLRKSQWTTLRG
jgi:hypothetical protein